MRFHSALATLATIGTLFVCTTVFARNTTPDDRLFDPTLSLSMASVADESDAEHGPVHGVPARGEFVVSGYFGKAWTHDSDLRLRDKTGTDLTFSDVSFDDRSFVSPIFYGARVSYWFGSAPNWGLNIDFTHAKAIVDTSQVTPVFGTAGGEPVNGSSHVSDHLELFELSHGLNFLTVNAMHRWFPAGQRDDTFLGRLQPYVGVGAGVAIPHVEATLNGVRTFEYQPVGPAVQGFAGVNFDIWGPLSAFVEYKLTWSDLSIDLAEGATIDTELWTHQLFTGLSLRF